MDRLIIIFFAEYFIWVLTAAVVIGFLWAKRGDFKSGVYYSLLALVSASLARLVIKPVFLLFVSRPRPFMTSGNAPLIEEDILAACCNSFPSGHALFVFALATTVFMYNKKWGMVAYICALLVGIARVLAGVHFPTDILGGAVIGAITAWIIWHIAHKFDFFEEKVYNRGSK